MAKLASFLSRTTAELGHRVPDRMGLSGLFTFTLEWTPGEKASSNHAGPSLLIALQEQLGLKLEPGKATVEVIVVDHAEKQSEN
jgi:uncharacterized protein (TIGR03435 family)